MRVQHRRWHRAVWLVLPALVAVLFVAALAVKPPAPGSGPAVVQGKAR